MKRVTTWLLTATLLTCLHMTAAATEAPTVAQYGKSCYECAGTVETKVHWGRIFMCSEACRSAYFKRESGREWKCKGCQGPVNEGDKQTWRFFSLNGSGPMVEISGVCLDCRNKIKAGELNASDVKVESRSRLRRLQKAEWQARAKAKGYVLHEEILAKEQAEKAAKKEADKKAADKNEAVAEEKTIAVSWKMLAIIGLVVLVGIFVVFK